MHRHADQAHASPCLPSVLPSHFLPTFLPTYLRSCLPSFLLPSFFLPFFLLSVLVLCFFSLAVSIGCLRGTLWELFIAVDVDYCESGHSSCFCLIWSASVLLSKHASLLFDSRTNLRGGWHKTPHSRKPKLFSFLSNSFLVRVFPGNTTTERPVIPRLRLIWYNATTERTVPLKMTGTPTDIVGHIKQIANRYTTRALQVSEFPTDGAAGNPQAPRSKSVAKTPSHFHEHRTKPELFAPISQTFQKASVPNCLKPPCLGSAWYSLPLRTPRRPYP